jgi:hypothetical protein
MQQRLECVLDNVEVDLAQFVLFDGGTPNKAASGRLTVSLSRLAQQLRQLGDIGRDPPRLILAEQLGRQPPPRLILEIETASWAGHTGARNAGYKFGLQGCFRALGARKEGFACGILS